jgi:hypothetical protein
VVGPNRGTKSDIVLVLGLAQQALVVLDGAAIVTICSAVSHQLTRRGHARPTRRRGNEQGWTPLSAPAGRPQPPAAMARRDVQNRQGTRPFHGGVA